MHDPKEKSGISKKDVGAFCLTIIGTGLAVFLILATLNQPLSRDEIIVASILGSLVWIGAGLVRGKPRALCYFNSFVFAAMALVNILLR